MNQKQTTLKASVSLSGKGLHTGALVNITFKPAPENHGYKFCRTDIEDQPIINADADNVTDTSRGTTITQNGASVSTIEHTLAALVGLEIDNVLIELDGPECPIMDGSAMPFVEAIELIGIETQEAEREYFTIPHNVTYMDEERGVEMIIMPAEDYRVTVMVDYNSPVLGTQHASLNQISEFKKNIAPARTFCFLHELESLLEHNLIKGGDLDNAIVVVDRMVSPEELDKLSKAFNRKVEVAKEGILNTNALHFQNEPARHKLLDVIGDLALVGMPLKGHVMGARPGHAANVAFAKKIKQLIKKTKQRTAPQYDPMAKPVYDVKKIMATLPHRPPFLMIDKIIELVPHKYVIGLKNVTMNEPFFVGHFPGEPVMPGVLLIEAMAQAGGILILNGVEDPENYVTYFLKIDNARFKDKVVPGDTVLFHCTLVAPVKRGICQMVGKGYVGEKLVVEADLMAQIVRGKAE